MNVPIAEIFVGERRREDMGDIGELAESIKQWGLFHPLVVDETHQLISGGRRLAACKQLGWERVPVRYFANLNENEKRKIELEENVKRKDLTSIERSKNLVELGEVAAEIDKVELARSSRANSVGHPVVAASAQRVADQLGVDRQTLRNAQQHVAATEKYPELADLSQREAIQTAKMLDAIPSDLPPEVVAELHQQAKETVTSLTRVRRFADLFLKYSNLVGRVQGEASNDEIFEDFDLQQAEWFMQQTDEVIETFQSWRAALCRLYPQLKTKGLRQVH